MAADGTGDEDLLTGELLVDDPAAFLPPIRPKLRDESKLLPADDDDDDDGEEVTDATDNDDDADDEEEEEEETVDEDDSLPKGELWWLGLGLVWWCGDETGGGDPT